jgi:FkbM family methyltransferase
MATAAKAKAQPSMVPRTLPVGATWATVTTLKEPPERVKAFVAQHTYLGAAEIWLYFDDPDDPSISLVEKLPQVRVVRCTAEHKAAYCNKAGTHEGRQKANANHAYSLTKAEWMIHLDADEMVDADRPIASLLAEAKDDVLRLAPYEAMHYGKAAVNGRPAYYFRGALPGNERGQAAAERAYGRFAGTLAAGMLSHSAGKYFVRTGLPDALLSIHAPFRGEKRAKGVEVNGARLLHFHGYDYEEWRAHLDRRLTGGAYIAKFQKDKPGPDNLFHTLVTLQKRRGESGLRKFWSTVCEFGPEKRILAKHGALHRCNLWLEAKVASVFGGDAKARNPAQAKDSGAFEADVSWRGLKLRVVPDNNFTECLIARGEAVEEEELATFEKLVKGRKVLFYDIGGNAGIFSLVVAKAAKAGSKVIAFEPNPEMQRRFARNVALNKLSGITLRPIALGDIEGDAFLSIVKAGNLGQASLRSEADGQGYRVPIKRLPDEMIPANGFDLTLMKIDVEGHEPGVLAPLLDPARKKGYWPDIIMLEHTAAEAWGVDLIGQLMASGYAEHHRTSENTFLKRAKTKG